MLRIKLDQPPLSSAVANKHAKQPPFGGWRWWCAAPFSELTNELGKLLLGLLQPSVWGVRLAHVVTAFSVGFDGWTLFTSTRRLSLGRALGDALNPAVFGAQQVLGGLPLGASDESSEICCKQKAAKSNTKELNHV